MLNISILAGGPSLRMGRDKTMMPFHGAPMIERVIARVTSIADELNIIANEDERFQYLHRPVIHDSIPGRGVLGGIFTALQYSNQPFTAAVGCDLPFISSKLLFEETKLIETSDFDVILPESDNGLETLYCIYRRETCLPLVEKSIADGRFRIISWFDLARVKVLPIKEVKKIDPDQRKFMNLNNPLDYENALLLED